MRRTYKNLIRTLLLLLVFSIVFPFVYPWKDGKPLLSLNQLKFPALPDITLPELPLSTQEGDQKVTVYKWQDVQGNWQFGNQPPQGVTFEILELDPNTNLLAAEETSPATSPAAKPEKQVPAEAGSDELVFGYTPDKIEAMMEKTRQVRDSMNAHHQSLEGLNK